MPGDIAVGLDATSAASPDGAATPVGLAISGQATTGAAASLLITQVAPLDEGAATLIDAATGATVDLVNADPETHAPGRSLRPQPRPALLAAGKVALSDVRTVAAPGPATEIDPASLVAGTRLAQLGAFDTLDLARERFAQLQGQFGDLMAGKGMVVQAAQSGGRSFYRLRAHGFAGDDEARRFCAALQAEDTDCIPVAQR